MQYTTMHDKACCGAWCEWGPLVEIINLHPFPHCFDLLISLLKKTASTKALPLAINFQL